MTSHLTKYILILYGLCIMSLASAQYIHEVLEYRPAPGQHINSSAGIPEAALSIVGSVNGLVSLGAFGGYIIFRFEKPVVNDPDNPFGIDFTIFGNPSGNWSEPGIVSVMKDFNRNDIPDDTWYELAGSQYKAGREDSLYRVTYTNPIRSEAADIYWEDNRGDSGYVFANSIHTQPYYPDHELFPAIRQTQYSLSGSRILLNLDSSNQLIESPPLDYGYADNHRRGAPPYTTPDNPLTPEIEGAGGDPMDIGWAVDQAGDPVVLDTIHFVRIHTAVNAHAGVLGEISTEITGAAVVMKATATNESIAYEPEAEPVNAYPNPCGNNLTISGGGEYIVRLLDGSGKELYLSRYEGDPLVLDMTSFETGIYLLHLYNGNDIFTTKIVKR